MIENDMGIKSTTNSLGEDPQCSPSLDSLLNSSLEKTRNNLNQLTPEQRILWAYEKFNSKFAITTSFGIQSAVLLNMIHNLQLKNTPKIIWVDTGYLPKETYIYAETLMEKLDLKVEAIQSVISPARMEALYGKLWETNSIQDIEKYHDIRKVEPLDKAFKKFKVECWASGVRGEQTSHRKGMTVLDLVRNRLSIRPLLNWSKKDIFYYMEKNKLPQHPLFFKGFSTVGDHHSSSPDNESKEGRETRFGGLKQECGIHLSNKNKEK